MIVKFTVRSEHVAEVMNRAGYILHHNGISYIRTRKATERFHIYPQGDFLNLHYDLTVKHKHKLARGVGYGHLINSERKRIKSIWKSVDPLELQRRRIKETDREVKAIERRKQKHEEFAPNLMELQRNFKGIIYPLTLRQQLKKAILKIYEKISVAEEENEADETNQTSCEGALGDVGN